MLRLLLTLALMLVPGLVYAQPISPDGKVLSIPSKQTPQSGEPPLAKDDTGPKAVLVGPTEPVQPGAYVRLKTNGSNGKDFKLTVFPTVKNFDLVTFQDGTTGVICQLTDPGTYVFCLALNSENKTDLVMLPIKVELPAPPPVPSVFEQKFIDAYAKDGKPAEKKAYLVAIFKQMATEKAGRVTELHALLAATVSKSMSESDLRNVRDVCAEYLIDQLGKTGDVNVDKQRAAFTALAEQLLKLS